jgi:ribosome maturation protein SDO1
VHGAIREEEAQRGRSHKRQNKRAKEAGRQDVAKDWIRQEKNALEQSRSQSTRHTAPYLSLARADLLGAHIQEAKMSLMLPQGQKLLTNVTVVRIKKGKEKFEIAAYPNTVAAFRNGVEKNVREVLQIDRVFRNVEQGEYAKSKDLQKAFGTDDQEAICIEILKHGEMQLSERERSSQKEALLKEICTMVAERCINSQSKRPVTVGVVERALAELHYNVDLSKNAKKQALEAIKLLESKFPIERLPMNLKITFPLAARAEAREQMIAMGAVFDREDDSGGLYVVVCKVAPDKYRDIDAVVRTYQLEGGLLEVLQLTQQDAPDSAIDSLQGLSLSAASHAPPAPENTTQMPPQQRGPGEDGGRSGTGGGLRAATAPGVVFATREELAAHMRSDWHKHNLALKASGKPMVSKEQFVDFSIMASDPSLQAAANPKAHKGSKAKNKKKNDDIWD